MALHEQSVGASDEWYTPPHVFEAMGVRFGTDVAHPAARLPWIPAQHVISANSLSADWTGAVWMNPPFGGRNGLYPWLEKFFLHLEGGVALVPDRTSAPWWQDFAWQADAILFVRKKIRFIRPDGSEGKSPAQGTCLLARGWLGETALENARDAKLGLLVRPATLGRAA